MKLSGFLKVSFSQGSILDSLIDTEKIVIIESGGEMMLLFRFPQQLTVTPVPPVDLHYLVVKLGGIIHPLGPRSGFGLLPLLLLRLPVRGIHCLQHADGLPELLGVKQTPRLQILRVKVAGINL